MKKLLGFLGRVVLGYALGFALLVVLVAASRASLRAPAPSLILQDRHGEFMGEVSPGGEDAPLGYWPVEALPERVVAATLALEDKRFAEHPGVDFRAVGRAVLQNLESGEVISGASTLAMQVARMQDPGPRRYGRKAVEAVTALMLTARYGREAILHQYLTLVPYGNRIRGIRYAAKRYLDKPVEDLSWAETAFLCALPQAPSRTNPFHPEGRRRAVARAQRILTELHGQGLMDDAELELARKQLSDLRVPTRESRPPSAMHALLRLEARLATEPLDGPVLRGDPVVTTTLDLPLQAELARLVNRRVRALRPQGADQAALIVVERETGEVVAAVGSADWGEPDHAGAIDYTQVPRLPGSTLKPFLYAAALDLGVLSPDQILDDLARGPEGIRNADSRFLGPLLPRQALGNSRNVPAVLLLQELGVDRGYALLRELGLHEDALPGSYYGLGLAIGGMPVSLEQLVTAYTALAYDGRYRELAWVRGEPVAQRQVLSAGAARTVTRWLADPLARLPSFPRMGFSEYPFPVAVKTGTSGQFRDAWAVAVSERYIVGAWLGHPDARPMAAVSGYRGGARLAQDVLELLHADQLSGREDLSLPEPEGWTRVGLCALSGQRATDACDRVIEEAFAPGTEPHEDCSAHVRVLVDDRNGLLAAEHVPPEHRRARVFVDLDPQYADWAAQVGLQRPPTQLSMLGAGEGEVLSGAATPLTPVARVSLPGQDLAPLLRITAPGDGVRLVRDPETPPEAATLALRVSVDPPVPQITWYVDGEPYEVVDAPYTTRWRLEPGRHRFEARVPFTEWRSEAVVVEVR
ncbi:MAG: transglycosylase domain-containing protein [Alphaproteobacteria bacterium]|nr:transglycosylase domain-containing protein [Alphaproteobacteria bacterium]